MDSDLAAKILEFAGKSGGSKDAEAEPEEVEAAEDETPSEGHLDAHYGSMARELIDALHGKDLDSVKRLLRMLGKE